MEKKIRSGWAYSGDEKEKASINREIYEEIKHLGKAERIGTYRGCNTYRVTATTNRKLTPHEMALIADQGNLCFGYRCEGTYIVTIYTD